MTWEVEGTDEFADWYGEQDEETQEDIIAAVAKLQERGPSLGRPLVDTIKSSRYPNMKELIPMGGNVRIVFAFDPRRMAILLIGGDKTNRWNEWYEKMVPVADRLYEEHLLALRKEREQR